MSPLAAMALLVLTALTGRADEVAIVGSGPADGAGLGGASPGLRLRNRRVRGLAFVFDGYFLYGIGGQSFLGAQVGGAVVLPHWSTRHASGAWELGLQGGYQNEPTFLAPWIDPRQVRGAAHRIQLLATAGHTFHLGARRRVFLGIHLLGGFSHWRSDYSVAYDAEGVAGSAVVSRDRLVVGGQLKVGVWVHRRVALGIVMGGPFPIGSSYVDGMFHVGLGLTFRLR